MNIYLRYNNQSIIDIINKEIGLFEAHGLGDYCDGDWCKDRYIELELELLGDEADNYAYGEWWIGKQEEQFEEFMGQLRKDIEWAQKYGDLEDSADDLAQAEAEAERALWNY